MTDIFLEIVVKADEAATAGIESRDEIEDPLASALFAAGIGEVTGGGGGSGVYVLDVEIEREDQFDAALTLIRDVLRSVGVPPSTVIKRHKPQKAEFSV
jgi:hypothetical protein